MQGHGSSVSGSEKAGSTTSLPNDRNAAEMDNLAAVASNASSDERSVIFVRLDKKIAELAGFIKPKNNLHDIKKLVCAISSYYDRLRNIEEKLQILCRPEHALRNTQTSPGLLASRDGQQSFKKRKPSESPCQDDTGIQEEKKNSKKMPRPELRGRDVSVTSEERGKSTDTPGGQKTGMGTPVTTSLLPTAPVNTWRKVQKRKKKKAARTKPRLPRPDALILKPKEGASCVDILRNMKNDPDLQDLGTNVSKIRKSTSGNILLVLDRKAHDKIDQLRLVVAERFVDKAEIESRTDTVVLELKDLDELAEAAEVLQAFQKQVEGADKIDPSVVKFLRKVYGGT